MYVNVCMNFCAVCVSEGVVVGGGSPHLRTYIHTCTYVSTHIYIYIYICVCVRVPCTCIGIEMHKRLHAHMHVNIHTCRCIIHVFDGSVDVSTVALTVDSVIAPPLGNNG